MILHREGADSVGVGEGRWFANVRFCQFSTKPHEIEKILVYKEYAPLMLEQKCMSHAPLGDLLSHSIQRDNSICYQMLRRCQKC